MGRPPSLNTGPTERSHQTARAGRYARRTRPQLQCKPRHDFTVDTMSGTEIPQYVTRFYGTTDFALDVIQNKQIAFVHVSLLNDPFDPYCFWETDFSDSY